MIQVTSNTQGAHERTLALLNTLDIETYWSEFSHGSCCEHLQRDS